jgi:hypothetical protein
VSGAAAAVLDEQEIENPQGWAAGRLATVVQRVLGRGRGLELVQQTRTGLLETELAEKGRFPLGNCICLGIGRLSTMNAERQVALLQVLLKDAELFQAMGDHALSICEPAFQASDEAAIRTLGFDVLQNNVCGTIHKVKSPTLFFMPHCNVSLYNNIFWANWSLEGLSQVVLVGNDIRMYTEISSNFSFSNQVPDCLLRISKYIRVSPLSAFDRDSELERAFNNTCVQWFSRDDLESAVNDGVFAEPTPAPHLL